MKKTNPKTIEDIENMQIEFLKPEDVMNVIGIGKNTFYKGLKNNVFSFPVVKVGKRKMIIPKKPFLEYLKKGYCDDNEK